MKYIILLTLIIITQAQDGSNASNTTTNGTVAPTTTTTLRGVTTTLAYTTTPGSTTTSLPSTHTPTQGATTTGWPVGPTEMNTTTVPYCSPETKNSSCRVCLGPLCKFVERGEQGVGWEILFVAFALGLIGVTCLGIWYICLRPILYQNRATDILWLSEDSEDEEWHETAVMLTRQEIKRKGSPQVRAFEIVDLKRDSNE